LQEFEYIYSATGEKLAAEANGSFWSGFATGSVSSLAGSGLSQLGLSGGDLAVAMGGVGALTAWGTGGDPMNGFSVGFGIGMFNHGGRDYADGGVMEPVQVVGSRPQFVIVDGRRYLWNGAYYDEDPIYSMSGAITPVYPEFDLLSLGGFGRNIASFFGKNLFRSIGRQGIKSVGAAAAKGPYRALQTGGHTLTNRTLKGLGLTKGQANRAIHALKAAGNIPHNAHYKIMSNGDLINPHTGEMLGNMFDFIY
jgi:hypothetical protein